MERNRSPTSPARRSPQRNPPTETDECSYRSPGRKSEVSRALWSQTRESCYSSPVAKKDSKDASTGARITNRRAMHDYFISAKIECGMALFGTEVKSLRAGHAQLSE